MVKLPNCPMQHVSPVTQLTTRFEVEESVLKVSSQLRTIIVDHLLEELAIAGLSLTQIVENLREKDDTHTVDVLTHTMRVHLLSHQFHRT